jgi:hypothetical protein
MHLDFRGKQVVHDGQANVLLVALVAIHPEKFGQQRPGILKVTSLASHSRSTVQITLFLNHCSGPGSARIRDF